MKGKHRGTVSPWMSTRLPATPPLSSSRKTEICVVGAGISGLTTAYLLAREGKKVVVLDNGRVGCGYTSRTTAHLASAIDDRYSLIEQLHGKAGAKLAAESHSAAIAIIESIAMTEKIECGFERLDGYLFNPPGGSRHELEKDLAAARRAGLSGVEMVDRAPLAAYDTGPCLRFPMQGQFHPMQYLAGLARAFLDLGGHIHSEAHVVDIRSEGTSARIALESGREVVAEAVVVATNSPINDRFVIHTKQAPYTTYALALKAPVDPLILPALLWDTEDPYHYVRMQDQLLIIGGEDHKTGQADDADARWARLEAWARERFPMAGETAFRWSGQVMETVDGLAYIGRNPGGPENVYIATGDSGMGMTHGTIAGRLLSDLLMGRTNPWEKLYEPSRKHTASLREFVKENLNVAWQYSDWVTPGESEPEEKLAHGSGAVVRRGLTKVAVYRDEKGTRHERSAVCPHLGGIVSWNSAEATWDCPCHGSRFDAYGKVICGPAKSDLKPAAEETLPHKLTG